jgi:hypothetical protein
MFHRFGNDFIGEGCLLNWNINGRNHMRTKPLLKKGLVVGIIVLLGLNILPSMSCSTKEEYQLIGCSSNNRLDGLVNWTINGTKGWNDWYISPINISCIFDPDVVSVVYYNYNGTIEHYTKPFAVNAEGEQNFLWYWGDYQGNLYGPYVFKFRIDYTKPTIVNFTVNKVGIFKWKLTADVYDNTSGINSVEFFVDQNYIGNCTEPPYSIFWRGLYFLLRLKFFLYADWGVFPTCAVLDNAGNVWYLPIPSK